MTPWLVDPFATVNYGRMGPFATVNYGRMGPFAMLDSHLRRTTEHPRVSSEVSSFVGVVIS